LASPSFGFVKGNFNVVVRDSFAVAAAVIIDDLGNIILAASQKLKSCNVSVLQGEVLAALFVVWLVVVI
jgi:hypothetical protein